MAEPTQLHKGSTVGRALTGSALAWTEVSGEFWDGFSTCLLFSSLADRGTLPPGCGTGWAAPERLLISRKQPDAACRKA